jgi:hypothetical protein
MTEYCRECSKPERLVLATHGELCVYCDHNSLRFGGCRMLRVAVEMARDGATNDRSLPENIAARERLAAFDKSNAPRQTADSKMLALPHPWKSDEGEP